MDGVEKLEDEISDQIDLSNDQVKQNTSTRDIQNDLSGDNKFTTYKSTNNAAGNPKKRHNSQPGISYKGRSHKTRPVRSMVNMESITYDPVQRKFVPRKTIANELRAALESSGLEVINAPANLAKNKNYENHNDESHYSASDLNSQFFQHINENRNMAYSQNNNDTRSTSEKLSNRRHKNSIGVSMRSLDLLDLHSTSSEEKDRTFKGTLTTILSCMYGLFVITLGLIIFVGDIFMETSLSEFYCLYLVFIGLIYLIYLYIDIRIYTKKAHKYHDDKKLYEIYLESKDNDDSILSEYLKQHPKSTVPISPPDPLEHPYCFSQGRHAGSFYLKLGAAGKRGFNAQFSYVLPGFYLSVFFLLTSKAFFLGHLVHSVLFLSLHIIYLTSDKDEDCGSVPVLVLDIVYPLYSCVQLFFIFKYSNVIILKCKALARFVLMHCIASSLCFWVWTIIREIMEALTVYAKKQNKYPGTTTVDPDLSEELDSVIFPLKSVKYSNPYDFNRAFNIQSLADDVCLSVHGFENIIESVYPYLYPFTIEFNILIAGIFYILWQNIGNCPKSDELIDFPESEWDGSKISHETDCKLPIPLENNGETSNLTIQIDCHSANRGWFFGLILMVATIVIIIMCFIAVPLYDKDSDGANFGVILKDVSELCLHLIMLIAALVGYYQIRQLDVNHHPISLLDDLLLFICIPAFYMEATFTIVPTAKYLSFIKLFNVIIMVLQITVQTPFIIDALRRCSNSKYLRKTKPGRELVTFLIVCNVATWIFETFSVKNAETDDVRYEYYGKILWTILGHISTPLCMFYRFHSSVCLVDIWKCAYEPGNSH